MTISSRTCHDRVNRIIYRGCENDYYRSYLSMDQFLTIILPRNSGIGRIPNIDNVFKGKDDPMITPNVSAKKEISASIPERIARQSFHTLDTCRPSRTVTHLPRLNSVPTNAKRRRSRCVLTSTFSHCHLCHSLLRGRVPHF